MTPQQYERLAELFHAAIEIAPNQRAAFLDRVCDDDADLRRELESLLAAHEQGAYTKKPPDDIAAGLFLAQQAGATAGTVREMLAPRTRIDRYEIRSLLGKGGMGEVYLAEDTILRRLVALKVLPVVATANEDRMRRFVQEATTAAGLSHPHIAQIFEVGEHDGRHFIAMELVDGVTLRTKIHSERTELRKLLKYLQQVAEGLSKAHAAGIVHRDLKPDNIMITRDDYAKILDFGLAKLIEPDRPLGSGSDVSSEVATAIKAQHSLTGTVMGTAGYMSPEQAQGKVKEIDQRSDIFSFGCILFEAATGKKPFEGEDMLDSLHKIVHAPTPLIKETNANAPHELQRIVRRCLAKDPDERYQTIKDVALELKEVRQGMAGPDVAAELERSVPPYGAGVAGVTGDHVQTDVDLSTNAPAERVRPTVVSKASSAEFIVGEIKRHRWATAIIISLLALALAGGGYGLYRIISLSRTTPSFLTMKPTRLTTIGKVAHAAISPDGKYVAYVVDDGDRQGLWVKQLAIATSNSQIVPPTATRYLSVTFSPDDNYIYYVRQENGPSELYQVPVLGGPARKLMEAVNDVTCSPDGKQLAFTRARKLMIADADGTHQRELTPAACSSPSWSPDGKRIACVAEDFTSGRRSTPIVEVRVADGTQRPIFSRQGLVIYQVAWLGDSSGLVLVVREGPNQLNQLWYVSYPDGELRKITNDLSNYYDISVTADSGSLMAVQSQQLSNIWVAPQGDASRARQITSGAGKQEGASTISWTPDGKIVYVSLTASGTPSIWITEADGTGQRQITDGSYNAERPAVSPDGRYVVFESDRAGPGSQNIWRIDTDGTNLKHLTDGGLDILASCSPDGRWVIYNRSPNLWKVPIDGGTPVQLTNVMQARGGIASPDGQFITCWYVAQSLTQSSPKIAVIPSEGGEPTKTFDLQPTALPPLGPLPNYLRWTSDSGAVLYIATKGGVSNIWMQPIDGRPPKQVTDFKSERIFSFDWSKDGKQLALARGTLISDVVLFTNSK